MYNEITKIPFKSNILKMESMGFLSFHNGYYYNYYVSLGKNWYFAIKK